VNEIGEGALVVIQKREKDITALKAVAEASSKGIARSDNH